MNKDTTSLYLLPSRCPTFSRDYKLGLCRHLPYSQHRSFSTYPRNLVHQGVPVGKTIGPATSCRFSGPRSIDTIVKANGKVVPGPRLFDPDTYKAQVGQGNSGDSPCHEFPGGDN